MPPLPRAFWPGVRVTVGGAWSLSDLLARLPAVLEEAAQSEAQVARMAAPASSSAPAGAASVADVAVSVDGGGVPENGSPTSPWVVARGSEGSDSKVLEGDARSLVDDFGVQEGDILYAAPAAREAEMRRFVSCTARAA